MYAQDYNLIVANGDVANDVAMQILRNGTGDAIFLYAEQAQEYGVCPEGSVWNCSLWEGLGTEYAYVQTGQFGYTINGTTLSLSRKGSGIRELLRPCLQEFLLTKEYFDICVKYNITSVCYPNEFFGDSAKVKGVYDFAPTKDGDCSNGYCPCPNDTTIDMPDDSPPDGIIDAPPVESPATNQTSNGGSKYHAWTLLEAVYSFVLLSFCIL